MRPKGTQDTFLTPSIHLFLSIHAPHARRDYNDPQGLLRQRIFQSSHLMRGATVCRHHDNRGLHGISIHAPHTRCDSRRSNKSMVLLFQSTHPMRGATADCEVCEEICEISIHAPHARCDWTSSCTGTWLLNFNPRTQYGVRQARLGIKTDKDPISIHAPHARCDPPLVSAAKPFSVFQSTHLMRGATTTAQKGRR